MSADFDLEYNFDYLLSVGLKSRRLAIFISETECFLKSLKEEKYGEMLLSLYKSKDISLLTILSSITLLGLRNDIHIFRSKDCLNQNQRSDIDYSNDIHTILHRFYKYLEEEKIEKTDVSIASSSEIIEALEEEKEVSSYPNINVLFKIISIYSNLMLIIANKEELDEFDQMFLDYYQVFYLLFFDNPKDYIDYRSKRISILNYLKKQD